VFQLRELQQAFLKHLLGAPSPISEHIQSTTDTSAKQRLNIYASGYRLRLKEAITTDFDSLHGYLGDDRFNQLLDCYIDTYQSKHHSLRYYSQHIPELLAKQKPFSQHKELIELAKIEQAFNDSFDAADCATADIEKLGHIATESWPTLRVQFHASVQLLDFNYNTFAIWKALSEEKTPPTVIKEKNLWLIWRKGLVSRYRVLSDAEYFALTRAIKGDDFSVLCEGLLDYFDEENTPAKAVGFLQTWLTEMMVCDIQ